MSLAAAFASSLLCCYHKPEMITSSTALQQMISIRSSKRQGVVKGWDSVQSQPIHHLPTAPSNLTVKIEHHGFTSGRQNCTFTKSNINVYVVASNNGGRAYCNAVAGLGVP